MSLPFGHIEIFALVLPSRIMELLRIRGFGLVEGLRAVITIVG